MSGMVYKVCPAADWSKAMARGRYDGSPDDRRDGFIHLSTAAQLPGTLAKHFPGQRDLVLIAYRSDMLAPDLRVEPSRKGELFPHVYGVLDPARALSVRALTLGPDGIHLIPEDPD